MYSISLPLLTGCVSFWQGSTVFIFRNVDVLIKVPCISFPPLSIAINFCHINTHKTVLMQEVTLNFHWVLLFCSINIFFYTSICHLYFYLKWYQNIYEIIYCINVFQLIKVISAYNVLNNVVGGLSNGTI